MARKQPAKRSCKRGVDLAQIRRIALALPTVEEGTSYGTPAFRVRKKLFARMRKEGEDLVLRVVDDDLREALLGGEPDVFHQTEHYAGHPYVLARLATLSEARLGEILEEAWRSVAPAKLVAARG